MPAKHLTNEEICRLLLKDSLTPVSLVTQFPLVDASAQAINGGKTVFCEPKFTEQEWAILKETFKNCYKPSITK